MAEDKVSVTGEQLTAAVQSSWDQFIKDIEHSRKQDQLLTLLAKHVRDPEVRVPLMRRVRIVFLKRLPRDRASVLLGSFYVRLVEAVAASYDRLSPLIFPALMSAPNSQVMSFPTEAILDGLYGKPQG